MTRTWIRESPARWDRDKRRLVAGAPTGVFDSRYQSMDEGDLVPGEWWRIEEDGRVVAFGWLDAVFGDAEVLVAVDVEARGRGLGTYVLDMLEEEARAIGLNLVYNMVRPTHPKRDEVAAWLERRGFRREDDGRHVRGRASIPPRA